MKSSKVVAIACVLTGITPAFAGTINFDNAPAQYWETGSSFGGQTGGGQDLGGYYQGVTFGPDAQITTTSSGYPAHSGNFELTDANFADPVLSMKFNVAQTDVSFWYTTAYGFTAVAYGQNGNVIKSINEASNTTGITGSDSLLDFGVGGIYSVVITDPSTLGQFITIDDLTASGVNGLPVPDASSTMGLFGVAGAALWAFRRKVVA